ncbi:hypothetical protein XENORESO_014696 [Xenotaenia resolanae]|uniref:Uncharacterized protein n=1 Tax=Xenotaenia resolanae TaxID=208358 RepID=A0ABV0W493_9TELE
MYPRDGVGPEEAGAKAGVLGPGLLLLQQVGCWHLNLSSWVSNAALLPCFLSISAFSQGSEHRLDNFMLSVLGLGSEERLCINDYVLIHHPPFLLETETYFAAAA